MLPFLRHASLVFLGAVLAVMASPGCAWYAPPAGDRYLARPVQPIEPSPWPARATNRLEEIIQIAPRTFSIRVHHEELIHGQVTTSTKSLPADNTRYSGIYGRGIIRTFRPSPGDPEPAGRTVSLGMRFYSGIEVLPNEHLASINNVGGNDVSDSARSGRRPWVVNLRGTWMRLDEPLDGAARGLVIHLTSYGGFAYEKPVLDELRSRGWAVLWVDSSTVRPETVRIPVDPNDLDAAARVLAGHIDDRIAEIAYAVEAGLEFIARERPFIPLSPLAVTAYSAGALAAPAVVALMPHRTDAAVLVGGGANILEIAQRSSLTDGGLRLEWPEHPPTPSTRQRLFNAYLKAARLDPYWTSEFLRGKPVLILHAMFDRIVPAANGDLLYYRLGRPARMNFMLGHALLFYRLPSQARTIADWVESAAPDDPHRVADRRR